MITKKEKIKGARGIKIVIEENGKLIGRAFLYLINNDLHKEPYGLMEDVFVDKQFRNRGIGSELIEKVIKEAKALGCYKVVAQSRYANLKAHSFYKKIGFKDHGKNFRIDFE